MKQIFHITPFEATKTLQPVFLVKIGKSYCAFGIIENASQELKQLAYYSADEINEIFLSELFNVYSELAVEPHKVYVCYDYPQQTMIPSQYYKAEDAQSFLHAMNGGLGDASIISELVPDWQIYNVYAVPKDIFEWVNTKFPDRKSWHHSSIAIKSIEGADVSGCISIDIGTDHFSLLAGRSNTFLLAQNFNYSTPADMIYYLLKTCQHFDLLQSDVKILLSGLIERDSALYKILHQYFLNLEFRKASWNLLSNEYPAHFFTSLNDLVICES